MAATATSGELQSINPATLEIVGSVRTSPPEEIPEAVAEARLVQERWGRTSWEERRRLLRRVAQVVVDRSDEIAATVTAETGKPLVESLTTVVGSGPADVSPGLLAQLREALGVDLG